MRIGELAERSGVSVRALRYYEEQGLLRAERTPAGQRVYDDSAVEKVLFFQDMYAAGLRSRNIAALLPCFATGQTSEHQRRMLRSEHARIQEQIGRLQTAAGRLEDVIQFANNNS